MQRFIVSIALFVGVFVALFYASEAAGEVPIDCGVEPTVKAIKYGDYLDGPNCVINGGGDVDQFTFVGKKNERVILQANDQNGFDFGVAACITLNGQNGQPTLNGGKRCNEVTARIDETLPTDGTYTIVVQEQTSRSPQRF